MNHTERARTFLRGAFGMFGNGLEELWKIILAHKKISVLIALVALGGGVSVAFFLPKEDIAHQDTRRGVRLVRISDLSGIEPLSLIGEVRSVKEAQVAPDISGAVRAVYRSLGDFVSAGTVIAELKNDTQRAAVAQARAALNKAKGASEVGTIGIGTAQNSYEAAEEAAVSVIATSYAGIEDAVKRKADQVFSNPNSAQPKLFVSTSNSQLALTVESGRLFMQTILVRHTAASIPESADGKITELETLLNETDRVGAFLSNLVSLLSNAIATGSVSESAIALYRADAGAALASINALRSMLSGSIENLRAKRAAVEAAEQGLAFDTTGQSADVAASEANLASALAQLEKTIIRAPISGTINRLDLDVGNFVNASVSVVHIVNPGGLEVVAYLSARDIADIVVGAQASVQGQIEGVVVKKAQALDPLTKKAELRIGLPANSGLVSGQSTTLSIERAQRKSDTSLAFAIPLSAVKITPEGPVVFSVSSEDTLIAVPVVLGGLRGSKVDVEEGVTADMIIVEDARGLKEGQEVMVSQ